MSEKPENLVMEVGQLREILSYYDTKAKVLVAVDLDDFELQKTYHTYGGEHPDRIVLQAATKYKAMILSPAEQEAIEKMREKDGQTEATA